MRLQTMSQRLQAWTPTSSTTPAKTSGWKLYVPLPSTATAVVLDYTPPVTCAQERFASSGGGRGSTKSHSKHFHLKLLVPQSFMVRMLPGTNP
jgi:hypothetical protein